MTSWNIKFTCFPVQSFPLYFTAYNHDIAITLNSLKSFVCGGRKCINIHILASLTDNTSFIITLYLLLLPTKVNIKILAFYLYLHDLFKLILSNFVCISTQNCVKCQVNVHFNDILNTCLIIQVFITQK